ILAFTASMDSGERYERRTAMTTAQRISIGIFVLLVASWCGWVGARTVLAHRYAAQAADAKEVLDWDRALRLYFRARAFDPNYPEPYARIGDIYRTQAAVRAEPG